MRRHCGYTAEKIKNHFLSPEKTIMRQEVMAEKNGNVQFWQLLTRLIDFNNAVLYNTTSVYNTQLCVQHNICV